MTNDSYDKDNEEGEIKNWENPLQSMLGSSKSKNITGTELKTQIGSTENNLAEKSGESTLDADASSTDHSSKKKSLWV